MATRGWAAIALAATVLAGATAGADEKTILAKDAPRDLKRLKLTPDGSRIYAAGSQFVVFSAAGHPVDRIAAPGGCVPKDLIPLPDGWFIACTSYANGHLALCRPDGSEARSLVTRVGDEQHFRTDMTGWSSPCGAAVDIKRKRIFALDSTAAPAGTPSPDWSRIAGFDFEGKYLGDINRYDGAAPNRDDSRRTLYADIALDAARERIYVLANRPGELLAFGYDGKPLGHAKAPGGPDAAEGGLAVFANGRVAVGQGREIRIFDPALRPIRTIELPAATQGGIRDVEADAEGRLYALVGDPTLWFLRWPADLKTPQAFGPDYLRIEVEFPAKSIESGRPFAVKARATGRPEPAARGNWRAMARPADGTDLTWRALPVREREGELLLGTPPGLRGLYEVAVRYGEGPIDRSDLANDPHLLRTLAFVPRGADRSVSAFTADGRRAYRQGEPIPVQVVRRGGDPRPARVRLDLTRGGAAIASAEVTAGACLAVEIPGTLTRRLAPGRYQLAPEAPGHEGYALPLDIAPAAPDSPLQRILYHEFGSGATAPQAGVVGVAEGLAAIRDHARATADLGFTRETDRLIGQLDMKAGPVTWRRGVAPADLTPPGAAPADFHAVPYPGAIWEPEAYLDQAVRRGLAYDSQLLIHCSGVRFREPWLRELAPVLQRGAQWLGRYPAFYGFNYNDEMFFAGFGSGWTKDDDAWLKQQQDEKFPGRPRADVLDHALRTMYDRFNAAVRQADPAARITTTPMWQFPAVDGSYAPVIYRGMSETYSHFLSEGFGLPWNPAHSVELLRRPGLPMMGVFDNGYKSFDGDVYFKNVMQVAARGVQGVGVEHVEPFAEPQAADNYRVANWLARLYGPIFAEAPPLDEATVLYSRTQDLTEARNTMGTPHWERVYALVGAGLMAGVPMGITYEEDILDGRLLEAGRPRAPMLILAGQVKPLPPAVRAAIAAYIAAGGRVFADADSAEFPGAARISAHTHVLKGPLAEGFPADSTFPLAQPPLETLAGQLAKALGPYRRFPMDTDDLWVSKNRFDGGAIRYVMLASESSPNPWDAGATWSLGTYYSRSYLPRTVALRVPHDGGVIYDVFDHAIVRPTIEGKTARLAADLTTAPGRLYALAPAPLAAPRLTASVAGGVEDVAIRYTVGIVDAAGRTLPARVPIRVRLLGDRGAIAEQIRGTGADGTFADRLPLPVTGGPWTLEVTELLGGTGGVVTVAADIPPAPLLAARPDVEALRPERLRALIETAGGSLTLALPKGITMSPQQFGPIAAALKGKGIRLEPAGPLPAEPERRVYLAVGVVPMLIAADAPDDLAWLAWSRGLLPRALSMGVPGPGRGLFAPAFAPRGDGEHAIVLIGGDGPGLEKTLQAFVEWIDGLPRAPAPGDRAIRAPIVGKPGEVGPLPRLADRVGVRLSGAVVAADGKHLAVTADGYAHNLALVEDQGTQARVVRVARVGQAPKVDSPFVADDGATFGASGRTTDRHGDEFRLVAARSGAQDVFASFGDTGRHRHHFAAGDRGELVLAPGPYGVVCWRRDGGGAEAWRESWAIDGWKRFPGLDWPVDAADERSPQFHAFVPRGADHALILFAEKSDNGWTTNEHPGAAWLAAVGLADGKERWHLDVPIPRGLLFPRLHASPDGARRLLEVQTGASGNGAFRLFSLGEGKVLGTWDSRTAPAALAVADATGVVAGSYQGRLLEVRRADGLLLQSRAWPDQPCSLAFAADGRGLYVADDAGVLTHLDARGREAWRVDVGCNSTLVARGDRLYAAGWDGRLRCFAADGRALWTLDLTPALNVPRPMELVIESARAVAPAVHRARRPPTTTPAVPEGPNLLRDGRATLTLGGTPGWQSEGKVQVTAAALTNGRRDDVATPWLNLDELLWDSTTGRQVWAEVAFKAPTDVKSLTVFENPKFPASWPTDGLVQVWDDAHKAWKTAARSTSLDGPVNTYALDLKGVTKLRYVPWESYYRNFYTSEIEVR